MANRSMAAKTERARRQGREAASVEFSKPFYAGNATIAAGEKISRDTAAMVKAYLASGGKVTYGKTADCRVHRGKSGCDPRTRKLWNGCDRAVRAGTRYLAR